MLEKVKALKSLIKLLFSDRLAFKVIFLVHQKNLSYLSLSALLDLYFRVKAVETTNLPGILIEAGCALGGSALVITVAKAIDRKLVVFDTFEGMPPPTDKDGEDIHNRYSEIVEGKADGKRGNQYYGYREDLLNEVKNRFSSFGFPLVYNNVHLVKGLFQNTLYPSEQVALAHIDSDWYESVLTCLERITPKLVPDGVLIIDDYYRWSGCQKAVDEYFEPRKNSYRFEIKSRMHVVRK
jgi:asparagine synthase (glutamine-hydrolysing)